MATPDHAEASLPAPSPVGLHRVLEPRGVLPQAAFRLDPSPTVWRNELGVDVELLNLDAASYRQLRETYPTDVGALRAAVLEICAERGKLVNPVTGSGGMLVGTVSAVGPDHPEPVEPGTRIATLVSLTLTPLWLEDISDWDGRSEIVPARGHAIVFARSPYAVVPDDLPLRTVLSVLDVAGAPALVDRHVRPGSRVAVIGGSGKSGSLACVAAHEAGAQVAALVPTLGDVRLVESVGAATPVVGDATDPVRASQAIHQALGGPADLTAVCVDVADAEGTALLSTRGGGTVVFFSMATSFTKAALGAEGLGADVTLLIGNGYVPGHADRALGLVRQHAPLRRLFDWRAGVGAHPMDEP